MSGSVVLVKEDDAEKIEHYVALALLFGDNNDKDDYRAKAAQELIEGLETILASPHYVTFVNSVVPVLLKFLQNGEAYFVAEYHAQQARKTILELLHRLPCNDLIKPHARNILKTMFKLLEIDNEENAIICLRIIIELHKQFRPIFSPEVQQFLNFVKCVYKELPGRMDKIFDPKLQTKVRELPDFNTAIALSDIYTVTSFQCNKKAEDGSLFTYNVLPRARNSLKVLQELPIIVVLMYQIYKNNVQQEVAEFIPIVMSTITLQPTAFQRANPDFNKEVLVEFMGAQVKTLSFLAYIIKLYQDLVVPHSSLLVTGFINILTLCPMEVTYLRRELFIAARHIMATELRFKFVPYMEKLLDEKVLLGGGWTVNETMRPLAYSTLADFVHHVRQHLSLCDLNRAVMFFSCCLHDHSLPLSIQTMSCKLLYNLVESIRLKSESDGGNGREILMRMLDVLVYKLKTIAQVHIPFFLEQNKENAANVPTMAEKTVVVEPGNAEELFSKQLATEEKSKEETRRFGFPLAPMQNDSFTECQILVKTVVGAVKTISWALNSCNNLNPETAVNTPPKYKQLTAEETEVYLSLIKWGLKAVDIYSVNGPTVNAAGQQIFTPQRPVNTQGVRSKEEKEVLEHIAGTFTVLNNYSFREIFAMSIASLVERIHENNVVQVVATNLLTNSTTSAVFTTILVEYLLLRMPEMGDNLKKKSNLYLKLFKIVFGSVSLFPAENEQMLRPHLKDIVKRSLELALIAKDPYNYFLLLRALFTCIGRGSRDLLYQEFLPLLPSLLQGLISLQSGVHKQHVKDLLVELCLTVPARLSSLLPYLSMLMDPLISALNGSTTLISQGLRTLELFVSNVQPEFMYAHIQPVRAELMEALCRILRNANDSTAVVAFRILGKLGGSNRKMLEEPQKLEHTDKTILGQCYTLSFQGHTASIKLPVEKILEVALKTLRSLNPSVDIFYKKQAWKIVKGFIMSSIVIENDRCIPNKIILHEKMSQGEIKPASLVQQRPVCTDEKCRSSLIMGIVGIFLAVCVKELRREAYVFMIPFIRHIALIIVSQQTGAFCGNMPNMDPYVLFDAMAQVLAHEESNMKKPVLVALSILMNCIISIVRSKDRACALPMIEYLSEKMCNLCYERAWYTKMGGCEAISFFLDNMSLRWILSHHFTMVKAMYFVLADLTGEISAGALYIARENLAKLIRICATCSDENLHALKLKSLHEMTLEFVKHLTSPIRNIRNQSKRGLELLAEHQSKTVSAVLEPHKNILIDMVPPKKYLTRHQSIQSQLGVLDGNTFCLSLQPTLFTLDLNVIEHRNFVCELTALCEVEDQELAKLPCYKNVSNLTSVKMAIMLYVAHVAKLNEACPLTKEKIVNLFVKGIASSANTDLMKCAFECLQKFMQEHNVEMDIATNAVKPILSAVEAANMRTVTIPLLTQFSYLYQLFPCLCTDAIWKQLLQIFTKRIALALVTHRNARATSGVHELKLAVAILSLFPLLLPPSNRKFLEPLVKVCLQAEKLLLLGKGSPLRQPLMKFILRQPQDYLDLVLAMPYLNIPEWNRFFIYSIQQEDAAVLRQCLLVKPAKLIYCLNIKKNPIIPNIPQNIFNSGTNNSSTANPTTGSTSTLPPTTFSINEQNDIQYLAVKAMTVLSEFDENWILGVGPNREVVQALRDLWESNEYQALCNKHIMCCLPASSSALIPNLPPDTSNSPAHTSDSDSANATRGTPTPSVLIQPQSVTADAWSKLQAQTWKEPEMIAKLLLSYCRKNAGDIELLFKLLLGFCGKSISQFQFLKDFLEKTVTEYCVDWKRSAFFCFVSVFQDGSYPEELKAKIIEYILIPCMAYCFDQGEGEELICSQPMPDKDSPDNIVSVFLNQVIHPNKMSDSLRIMLCQLSCVLVEQASAHIQDAANKKQGNNLRRLMTFAWPCLLSKTCVDSSTKYYGHLLLSHIIAKFAIHKRIVLQVFHSLLKASALEAKSVVAQALDIITPALSLRMEDGSAMLIHWTKKILLEEGHSLSQLMHLSQSIVRQWRVYYPGRHMLVAHMISAMSRLGFTPTNTLEHRKLAVEMAEVIIKWELERIRIEDETCGNSDNSEKKLIILNENETCGNEEKKLKMSPAPLIINTAKALEKKHTDSALNFLLRLACHVNEPNGTPGSPGEILSKRCVSLVKTVMKQDVWANSDLQLSWFDKLFATIDSPQVNIPNICTAFELLTVIIGILPKEFVLIHMKSLHKGISKCLNSQNSKVIKSVHTFMSKLMSIFPTEFPGSSYPTMQTQTYDELEPLYVNVSKVVFEGLNNYEKVPNTNAQSLVGALMMCKSAVANNPRYIDRIITLFMKVLQRLAREHLNPGAVSEDAHLTTELLIMSLHLVKNRVGVMGVEMRKEFIGTVLVGLIEKSTDTKVMQNIIKILEEWVLNKNPIAINQGASLREKSILLVKLMKNVDTRFSGDNDLIVLFLELINFVYRDESLIAEGLNSKLERAFLSGLRCTQPLIREKFFEIWDGSIPRLLHDRIIYILCNHNWGEMGAHYWIKQCTELLLSTVIDADVDLTPKEAIIPGVAHNMYAAQPHVRETFMKTDPDVKVEPMDYELPFIQQLENYIEALENVDETDEASVVKVIGRMEDSLLMEGWCDPSHPIINVKMILLKEKNFGNLISTLRLSNFVQSLIQLIHLDTNLAEKVWTTLFPRTCAVFSQQEQIQISNEIAPFICSGVHVLQQNCDPSAMNTFVESVCSFVPAVQIKPCVLYYLGKTHNLWHRMTLHLEQMALDNRVTPQLKTKKHLAGAINNPSQSSVQQQEILDALSELYSLLREDDLWAGMWQCTARYPETKIAIAFEMQGLYEEAQGAYESVMSKARADLESSSDTMPIFRELKLWEDHWLRCCKELNQWDIVLEYSASKAGSNPMMVLESAWRLPNWLLMKEALTQVEMGCPKDQTWKVNMYRGYVSMLCSAEDKDFTNVNRYVEDARALCIKEWRKLPTLISNIHIGVLQAAQKIVELQESTQIHKGVLQNQDPTSKGPGTLHDVKSVVRTWINRVPCISEDLSHWSDVFTWRQQHYQYIANHFHAQNDQSGNQSTLGIHASAQAICHFGKIARKHNLPAVCLESLSKIYTIPSVPIVDCFQKIKQQVKCHIQQAHVLGRKEFQEALDIIESTNIKYFSEEMTCEFFAFKGLLLSQICDSEDANKAFSVTCQMPEALSKSWGFWGDYLETTFTRDARQIHLGISAVTAFMNSCRHQNEAKARKYIAKVLWLLMYDDEKGILADVVDKLAVGVPAIQWLPWVPQLLTSLVRHDGKMVINILNQVGRMYPQAVYFPIRTLYLTLKIEQRGKTKHSEVAAPAAATPLPNLQPTSISPETISAPALQAASTATASQFLNVAQEIHNYGIQQEQLPFQNLTPLPQQQQQLQQQKQMQMHREQHQQILLQQNHQSLKLQKQIENANQPQQQQSNQVHHFPYPQPNIEQVTEPYTGTQQNPLLSTPSSFQSSLQEANVATSSNSPSQPQPKPEAQTIKATPMMWRCSRVMHIQRDIHPTVLSSLEGIVEQIIGLRENLYEEIHKQLKIGLAKCNTIAFENRALVKDACVTPQLKNYVKKLVLTLGQVYASDSTTGATGSTSIAAPSTTAAGLATTTVPAPSTSATSTIETLLKRTTTTQDPSLQHNMKVQFSLDFDTSAPGADNLHNLILKLRKWIKIFEAKTGLFPKTFLMDDRFRFLQNFSSQIAEIELPGEFLIPKHAHYYVKIARFQPRIEVVQKHNTSPRRIFIRGHNGKIYPYLIVNDSGVSDHRQEERVMQMTRMLNHCLSKQKETAKRNLRFTLPKVVAVSPQIRLVEDNPASLSLLDIFKISCSRRNVEFDDPIIQYYQKIAAIQTKEKQVSHHVLREILKDIQSNSVPRTMLKEWAQNTFNGASDYWEFRKIFGLQLCLWSFAEYAFHLTRLNPEMMYLHKDSGMINISYFKFDIHDSSGDLVSNRPVSFRLTPNISEFLTPFGVQGPIISAMTSMARCLVYPNYKMPAILRVILRDEMISWLKKKQQDTEFPSGTSDSGANTETNSETVINMVTKSVNSIMHRMQTLSTFDATESKVSCLVASANHHDNLCRMDPAWHPWL